MVSYASKVALKRWLSGAVGCSDQLRTMLPSLINTAAPDLMGIYGVGVDNAAILLVAAGDNPQRLRSEAAFAHFCGVAPLEASSGKVTRHRLNRGGNRQANHALYQIIISRLAADPETKRYVERRTKDGNRSARPSAC